VGGNRAPCPSRSSLTVATLAFNVFTSFHRPCAISLPTDWQDPASTQRPNVSEAFLQLRLMKFKKIHFGSVQCCGSMH
jgi:hypothetical protein